MISAMDWRLWMSFSKPKMASWTGSIRTLVLKELNLYARVVPKTSLRRVSYFPTANMFDFNEQTKQPILTFLSRIADPYHRWRPCLHDWPIFKTVLIWALSGLCPDSALWLRAIIERIRFFSHCRFSCGDNLMYGLINENRGFPGFSYTQTYLYSLTLACFLV